MMRSGLVKGMKATLVSRRNFTSSSSNGVNSEEPGKVVLILHRWIENTPTFGFYTWAYVGIGGYFCKEMKESEKYFRKTSKDKDYSIIRDMYEKKFKKTFKKRFGCFFEKRV